MIRFFVSILMCCVIVPMSAQINMQDSTVTLTAYWSIGDKYKYAKESFEYEIQNNDTIYKGGIRETFTLEVIDSLSDGYILKYQPIEQKVFHRDSLVKRAFGEALNSINRFALLLKTNVHGNVTDIENWKDFHMAITQVVGEVKKTMANSIVSYEATVPTDSLQHVFNNLCDEIFASMLNKEYLLRRLSLSESFTFHGHQYEMFRLYEGKSQLPSPLDASVIDVNWNFWVEEYNPGNSWVKFVQEVEYDSDQLVESYASYMKSKIPDFKLQNVENAKIYVNSYFTLYVHSNTGWIDEVYYHTVTADLEKVRIKGWSIDLVDE